MDSKQKKTLKAVFTDPVSLSILSNTTEGKAMNNSMNYKSHAARIEFSSEDDCFIGHIAGIRDVVGFHADSVDALKQAFHEAVDDYLDNL